MRLVIMHFKTRVLKGILGRSHFGTNKKDNKYRSLAEEQKAYAGLGA
ncbi:cell division protein FtsL [Paraburkholderia sp. GAS82]